MPGPLAGVRIIDLSEGVAGPFAAKQLADLGADVIKVERPGGDPARRYGPFPGDIPHPEKSGLFIHLNTNKRSVVVDPATPSGRAIILQLAARAHALIESFPPGTLAAWGLGWDDLAAVNPRIVLTSVTPFGTAGPAAHRQATDLTLAARSSFLIAAGEPDREPVKYPGRQTELVGGLHAAWGTMVALYHADVTGEGQVVDTSILEAAVMISDQNMLSVAYWNGGGRARAGRRPLRFPPIVMPVLDGYVSLLVTDLQWPRFCRMAGLEAYAHDPQLATQRGRIERLEELEVAFLPWFLSHTKREVFEIAQRHGVPIAPFNTIAEVLDDPQFRARGYFRKMVHPVLGEITLTGPPALLTETPWELRRPAPLLDQHAEEILCGELGYRPEELLALRAEGATG
ncbi:MAG: CoA transferase [Chloroflexota bacterium]|nr:CoA transferase [Chloroflexota bacterium]